MAEWNRQFRERYVHKLFASIAHCYDVMNTVLSFSQDGYWRRCAVRQAAIRTGDRVLDVCCGTGKLSIELAKAVGPGGTVTGLDFCRDMLQQGLKNIASTPFRQQITLLEGNALELPFADHTFDVVAAAFALRTVADIPAVLAEMTRVAKPGAVILSLDLSKPGLPVFRQVYYLYFEKILPLLGKVGAGQSGLYSWLPQSLQQFPHQRTLAAMFEAAGLYQVRYYELTGGIATVHIGKKPGGKAQSG